MGSRPVSAKWWTTSHLMRISYTCVCAGKHPIWESLRVETPHPPPPPTPHPPPPPLQPTYMVRSWSDPPLPLFKPKILQFCAWAEHKGRCRSWPFFSLFTVKKILRQIFYSTISGTGSNEVIYEERRFHRTLYEKIGKMPDGPVKSGKTFPNIIWLCTRISAKWLSCFDQESVFFSTLSILFLSIFYLSLILFLPLLSPLLYA